jgi:hypothetical protein
MSPTWALVSGAILERSEFVRNKTRKLMQVSKERKSYTHA